MSVTTTANYVPLPTNDIIRSGLQISNVEAMGPGEGRHGGK